jgi:hypothetical protein
MTRPSVRFYAFVAAVTVISAVVADGTASAQDRRFRGRGGITVFRDENYRGESATFREDVPDLRRYGLGDRITSLQIPPGQSWEACESTNYRGRCQIFTGDQPDLRRVGWTDRISSMRRVRGGGGWPGGRPPLDSGKFGIVLYEDPFFRGRSVTVKDSIQNLRSESFHDRAESVRVVSGRWELCSEPNFRRCQVVDRDVPQLSALGLNKKLSSVRPVGWRDEGGYSPAYPGRAGLVLFERENYRGQSMTLESSSGDLGGWGNRARSLQVVTGRWLVCDRPGFAGRCREVSSSVPDLEEWGLRDRVMSARPIAY